MLEWKDFRRFLYIRTTKGEIIKLIETLQAAEEFDKLMYIMNDWENVEMDTSTSILFSKNMKEEIKREIKVQYYEAKLAEIGKTDGETIYKFLTGLV